ncbi:MAG: PAS domain S-box protein, partial [Proteobacteria bacterium]
MGRGERSTDGPSTEAMPSVLHRTVMRRFVVMAAIAAVVVGGLAPFAIERHEASRIDVIAAREQGYLSSVDVSLRQEFAEINGNLHVLATLVGALHATSAADAFAPRVEQAFSAAAEGYRRYAQLRFLDVNGMEQVRVDYRDGQVVPAAQRQDKSARPYFQAAMALPPGQHYVSPLELNMEHGAIETPLNPTIRFAALVSDVSGERVGVVVLNYRAEAIAERVRETVPFSHGVSSLLIDEGGQALVGGRASLGEAVLHRQDDADLSVTQPALWAALHEAPEGRWRGPAGLYLFRSVDPLGADAAFGTAAHAGQFAWTVLRFIPNASLNATSFVRSGEGRSLLAGMALGLLGALWLIAYYSVRESWQRLQRLRAAEAREAELGALIDAAPGGILVTDGAGRIVRANQAMETLFGYAPAALQGQSVDMLLPERLRGIHAQLRERFMAGPGHRPVRSAGEHGDFVGLSRTGEEVPVAVSLNVLYHDDTPYIVSSIVDLREHKAQARELQQAKEQAESASRAKSNFLATMSHEIRTPLNAIIGGTYLLGQSRLEASQRKDLETIEVSGRNLLGLINDVLDFSKIEAGELELDAHDFRLSSVLEELQQMFAPVAAAKGVGFEVAAVPDGLPAALHADGNRLRQMLINLIGNAIKFTETGTVSVHVSCRTPPGETPLRLRFGVQDSGVGIAPDVLPKLFDAFSQADASTTRRFGGSGLGLSIVKRLSALMGGTVGVESRLGEGSLFWLELPFAPAQGPLPEPGRGRPERPLQVIIADDDETDRRLMMEVCTRFGWAATVVESGQALVDACLARVVGGGQIDCILLDWRMPGMDGIEAIARLGD